MSSRFVSSGAIDAKTGESVPVPVPVASSSSTTTTAKKSAEWAAVQAQLDRERQQRAATLASSADPLNKDSNRSLYEILQANKAAKQAAFEEASKIKNQFRALDEDEIEFLDEVREKKRMEEERERREMEDGLRVFRERQKGVGVGDGGGGSDRKEGEAEDGENGDENGQAEIEGEKAEATAEDVVGGWAVARKRKRRKDGDEGLLKGVKRRASSGLAAEEAKNQEKKEKATAQGDIKVVKDDDTKADKMREIGTKATIAAAPAAPAAPPKPKMGLVDYGSDEDSD